MIKNKTVQLMYLTAACTLGVMGVAASFGLFEYRFKWDFYTYFTNLSNYLCLFVLIMELLHVLRRGEDGFIRFNPVLKFVGMVSISLTFVVYNLILASAPTKAPSDNFEAYSILFHVILPIMYVADWFLFYERKKVSWKYPIYSISFPGLYIVFVLTHAAILGFDSTILNSSGKSPLIYPYFFLNLENLGVPGLIMWLGILVAALLAFGFIFFGLDKLQKQNNIKEI